MEHLTIRSVICPLNIHMKPSQLVARNTYSSEFNFSSARKTFMDQVMAFFCSKNEGMSNSENETATVQTEDHQLAKDSRSRFPPTELEISPGIVGVLFVVRRFKHGKMLSQCLIHGHLSWCNCKLSTIVNIAFCHQTNLSIQRAKYRCFNIN